MKIRNLFMGVTLASTTMAANTQTPLAVQLFTGATNDCSWEVTAAKAKTSGLWPTLVTSICVNEDNIVTKQAWTPEGQNPPKGYPSAGQIVPAPVPDVPFDLIFTLAKSGIYVSAVTSDATTDKKPSPVQISFASSSFFPPLTQTYEKDKRTNSWSCTKWGVSAYKLPAVGKSTLECPGD